MGCDATGVICSKRFITVITGWIVMWGSCQEVLVFLHIPYRCKIEQTATRQCNGIKNSEMDMCM